MLILNPDAVPVQGIDALERAVLAQSAGAATGRLVGGDGRDQDGFNVRRLPTAATLAFEALGLNRIWPGNPVNRRYRHAVPETQAEIEQPAGAFLMVRRSAWVSVGGFDEDFYPIWFEDVDFCKRLINSGRKIVFVPEAVARHGGAHSASQLSWKERQVFWYGSLLRYAAKHMPASSRAVVGLSVMGACIPRTIAGMPRFGIAGPVSVFSRAAWLAWQCLRKGERGSRIRNTGQPSKEQFEQSKQSR